MSNRRGFLKILSAGIAPFFIPKFTEEKKFSENLEFKEIDNDLSKNNFFNDTRQEILKECHVPLYDIDYPMVRISEIKARRFYIVDRIRIKSKEAIQKNKRHS